MSRVAASPVVPRALELRPMRTALARMAAALRGAAAAVAVASALLGAVHLSWLWLGIALAVVVSWTCTYVRVAWHGLRVWLVNVDILVAAGLCLAIGHLVPAAALSGTVNWVDLIASMTVVTAQLGGWLVLSVPAGLLVAASAVAGSWLAHSPDGLGGEGVLIATQTIVAAAVMVAALRLERTTEAAFSDLEDAQAVAELERSRRAEERAQLRLMHNGPLTTLAMALHADPGQLGPALQERAAAALGALSRLDFEPESGRDEVRLDERLAQIVVWYQPLLVISADLPPCVVPGGVADAFAAAVLEALENVVRHADAEQATVALRVADRSVAVTVADRGRGFEPAQPPGAAFGLREDLVGRMEAAGGTATVQSSPGMGTVVRLVWHRA